MTIILDAGALLALESGDRELMALLKRERLAGRVPVSHGGVVGQAWRGGGGRQANMARVLAATRIESIDDGMGRRAGVLLSVGRMADVIDAVVVLLATDGDEIFTSDPGDLAQLAEAAGLHVELIRV